MNLHAVGSDFCASVWCVSLKYFFFQERICSCTATHKSSVSPCTLTQSQKLCRSRTAHPPHTGPPLPPLPVYFSLSLSCFGLSLCLSLCLCLPRSSLSPSLSFSFSQFSFSLFPHCSAKDTWLQTRHQPHGRGVTLSTEWKCFIMSPPGGRASKQRPTVSFFLFHGGVRNPL